MWKFFRKKLGDEKIFAEQYGNRYDTFYNHFMSEKMDEECRLTVMKIVCGQIGMAFEGKSVSIKSQRTRLPTDASQ
jgi:hypothetical protein